MSDFARKGKRARPRRFDTAAGIVRLQLANVGCRAYGRVFAPLLLMLDLSGRRRTDRLMLQRPSWPRRWRTCRTGWSTGCAGRSGCRCGTCRLPSAARAAG